MLPWLTATPGPARSASGQTELERIRELVVRAHYEAAERAAERYLTRRGLPAAERNQGLEMLAFVQVARRDPGAEATLSEIYRRDPGHTLSDVDASPVIAAAFARARENAPPPLRVALDHAPPRKSPSGFTLPVEVEIREGADAVDAVVVAYRIGEAPTPTHLVLPVGRDHVARGHLAVPGGPPERVRYHIEARAPSGAVLQAIGSLDDPYELRVWRRAAAGGTHGQGPVRAYGSQ
ncbi:MAG: hypothetical protein ACOCXM_11335 [Myxococcota bacterium]